MKYKIEFFLKRRLWRRFRALHARKSCYPASLGRNLAILTPSPMGKNEK